MEVEPAQSYDVVTAADVFIYVGRLTVAMAAVRRVLRPGGLFAFSVEAAEDSATPERTGELVGYFLGPEGRYAHSADYLTDMASRNDFTIELMRKIPIRFENRRAVLGWLAVFRSM
jgi:predicted TPR repeat methyltransferase